MRHAPLPFPRTCEGVILSFSPAHFALRIFSRTYAGVILLNCKPSWNLFLFPAHAG